MKNLIELSNLLLTFCERIGISRDILSSREEPEQIKYNDSDFGAELFKSLELPMLLSLEEGYGAAFFASFRFADLCLEINSSLDQQAFDDFYSKIEAEGAAVLEFRLELNKSLLVEEKILSELSQSLFEEASHCKIFLFFFFASLDKIMSLDIEAIEKTLWGIEGYRKIVILIPEHEINMNGPFLSIIGGTAVQKITEVLEQEKPVRETVESMYNKAQELLRWKGVEINHLTPLHFKTKGSASGSDPIHRAVCLHRAKMIVLYTANQTTLRNDGTFLAVFSSDKQRNEIVLNDLLSLKDQEIDTGSSKLLELVEWIYSSSKVEDSLYLYQLVVSRVLQITAPDDSYRIMLLKADYISKELRWLWKSFVEGKIDNYMSQVKSLEDYVAASIQSFSDQISLIIKNVSETMFAAVGVALASFVAALFKDKFDPVVFRIGIITYVAYLLIFPFFYNMTYQKEYFKGSLKSFIRRRNRFNAILDSDKVDGIVGNQLKESKKRFRRWFNRAWNTYLCVSILAFLSAIFIPFLFPQASKSNVTPPSIKPSAKFTKSPSPSASNPQFPIKNPSPATPSKSQ
jgi:hypothetical protein